MGGAARDACWPSVAIDEPYPRSERYRLRDVRAAQRPRSWCARVGRGRRGVVAHERIRDAVATACATARRRWSR
jgi:hypothetical protein